MVLHHQHAYSVRGILHGLVLVIVLDVMPWQGPGRGAAAGPASVLGESIGNAIKKTSRKYKGG
jgi:hypothetical protein